MYNIIIDLFVGILRYLFFFFIYLLLGFSSTERLSLKRTNQYCNLNSSDLHNS